MNGEGKSGLRWVAYGVAFFTIVIWGTTFVQTKILIEAGLEPDEIFFYRFLLAYLLILPFSHKKMWLKSWRDELLALSLGISGGSLYFITENTALAYGYCSNVALIVCLTPLTTAILTGWIFPKEKLLRSQWRGSLLSLAGMALVVLNGNFILKLSPLGDWLALAACLCWTLYSVLLRSLQGHYDTWLLTRKVFGYGVLTVIPFFLFEPINWNVQVMSRPEVWGTLLSLGCVASFACFLAWNWTLKKLGTIEATNFIYFNPVVTMIASWWILNERITWLALVGALCVLVGMYWVQRSKK